MGVAYAAVAIASGNGGDGCCDEQENFFGCAGWITYVILKGLLLIFTCLLCGFMTYLLTKNDPTSDKCPGILFSEDTKCSAGVCKDKNIEMKREDCPVDYLLMDTIQPDAMKDEGTGTWKAIQKSFTMCGYWCGKDNNCDFGDQKVWKQYGFQMTGSACYENVKKNPADLAEPDGCNSCSPKYATNTTVVQRNGNAVKRYEGASITGLRNSFNYNFQAIGTPITIVLYIAAVAIIVNICCMACLICKMKSAQAAEGGGAKYQSTRGQR